MADTGGLLTMLIMLTLELQPKVREDLTITEKAPTRAFSWLKAPTRAFTFKNRLRHYAKQVPSPWLWNIREPSFGALVASCHVCHWSRGRAPWKWDYSELRLAWYYGNISSILWHAVSTFSRHSPGSATNNQQPTANHQTWGNWILIISRDVAHRQL